jgi:mRNA interferase HigB
MGGDFDPFCRRMTWLHSRGKAPVGISTGAKMALGVRITALSTLKAFLNRGPAYADAREPLMAWYRQVKAADWAAPADVKRAIRSASILKDGRVVFNIAGNKYRLVVWINYPYRVVYIRFIAGHRQYELIDAQKV